MVSVDQSSATLQWAPAEVSVVGPDEEVARYDDSNFIITYLVQMQHVHRTDGGRDQGRSSDYDNPHLDDADVGPMVSEEAWCMQYWGPATRVQVDGLRPGRKYAIRVQCHPSVKDGAADVELAQASDVEPLLFRTLSSVPSAMLPPVLMVKGRTSLKLQLAEPDEHGGYPVNEYVVEGTMPSGAIDGDEDAEGQNGRDGMREIYRGSGRTFVWSRLAPGNRYSVRAKAVNQNGEGAFSSMASFLTQSAPPDAPSGIICMPTGHDSVRLRWEKPWGNGEQVSAYVVELDDGRRSGQGWQEIAKIQMCSLLLTKLRMGEEYRVRVCAENSEGRSEWSTVVTHKVSGGGSVETTSPYSSGELGSGNEKPGTPRNLRHERLKNSSVFFWDPTGPGVEDQKFVLEIAEVDKSKSAAHIWKVRYKSEEPRHEIHTLKSDLKYQVSVKAVTSAGDSQYCRTIFVDMQDLTGKVEVPATPSCLTYVDDTNEMHDGGARLAWHLDPTSAADCLYELYVANTEDLSHKKNYIRKNAFRLLYRGEEMSYALGNELVIGEHYTARVRAMRSGKTSEWSEHIGFERKHFSWAATVTQLRAIDVTPTSASFEWGLLVGDEQSSSSSPPSNCMDAISYSISLEVIDGGLHREESHSSVPGMDIVQAGLSDKHTTVGLLQPDSEYRVRVRAHNKAAHGPWSKPITIATPTALPSPPEMSVESKSQDTVELRWTLPTDSKGRCVIKRIEIQEKKLGHFDKSAPRNIVRDVRDRFVVTDLRVGSLYGFRIRLESTNGFGPWSRQLQVETDPGPPDQPDAPTVVPTGVGNAFKVNWRHPHDNGSIITDFELSLASASRSSEVLDDHLVSKYRIVYQGPDLMTRVQNLEFGAKYLVRVRASNICGQGPWSDATEIQTLVKPPEPPECVSADVQGDQVHVSWMHPTGETSPVCIGYDIEVKGHSSDKYRKSSMVVVARKTCNASMTSCTISQPSCAGEIAIRMRSIGDQGSGHGPWSAPCVVLNHGAIHGDVSSPSLSRTTSPSSKLLGAMLEPGSPGSGSKKYRRKAFQKTATAKLPKPRFALSNLLNSIRLPTRYETVLLVLMCCMLLTLYQTTMDVGFFGKPMRPHRGADPPAGTVDVAVPQDVPKLTHIKTTDDGKVFYKFKMPDGGERVVEKT